MISDNVYEIDPVIRNNLKIISERQSVLSEQMICELYEIASDAADYISEMLSSGYGIYEALGFLAMPRHGIDTELCREALPENRERISAVLLSVDSSYGAVLSELIFEELSRRGKTLTERDFLYTDKGNGVISYVRNPLADEAYDVLSERLDSPKVRYFKTMKESVASVVSGESEYCLLPLEERGGVRLFAVSGLILAEDLKIAAVTPVFGYDGGADMKYALISKHFDISEFSDDDDRYFEIRFSGADSGMSIADMLTGSRIFGITVYRINTLSFPSEIDPADKFSVVFKSEGKSFAALLVYLTLFCDTYVPVGIYKNLE